MNWNPDIGIPLAIAGAVLLAVLAVMGRPRKPAQGKRTPARPGAGAGLKREPSLGEGGDVEADADPLDADLAAELEALERTLQGERPSAGGATAAAEHSRYGQRDDTPVEHIVALFVAAQDDQMLSGPELVVAAEKIGLTYGAQGIYHRLVDGRPDQPPVFSVASMVKPGSFDLGDIDGIATPGLSFFMTLPGPLSALDAWDTMLPAAQRMAELLDAVVLDDQRNTLGRQRVAHIRDDLRNFDRRQERQQIRPGR